MHMTLVGLRRYGTTRCQESIHVHVPWTALPPVPLLEASLLFPTSFPATTKQMKAFTI